MQAIEEFNLESSLVQQLFAFRQQKLLRRDSLKGNSQRQSVDCGRLSLVLK